MLQKIKQLRAQTGVGVIDARKALEESGGDIQKAVSWINQHAVAKAAKKMDRATNEGAIFSYVHQTGKIAAMVKIGCETDFVAKTMDFQTLGKEIAMQIASMEPKNTADLLKQSWIREAKKTVGQLIKEHIAKLGENIQVIEFARMTL